MHNSLGWFGWVMVFNATSTIFQLYHDGKFYWCKPEKTTELWRVTDKLEGILKESKTNGL
jgi:hypothetical protein